jgi:hypothetical protein
MKTANLTGPQLDWAVAKALGEYRPVPVPKYSINWSQGGPLLERERLSLTYDAHWHYDPTDPEDNGERWYCELTEPNEGSSHGRYGPTPLVAAMRTLVASRLGPEIEIPQELV